MTKNTYPRKKRKTQYITGDTESVKEFIRVQIGTKTVRNWNFGNQTKGRKEARIKYWKKLLDNYEPPFEAVIAFKQELDEGVKFLPTLMRSFRVWIATYIQKWLFPKIDDVMKYAKLLSNYTGFKLGSFNTNTDDNADIDPLRARLEEIERKNKSKWTEWKWV